MNKIAPMGHNNPPVFLADLLPEFQTVKCEAENWLDGQEVANEGQMEAVDTLLASVKSVEQKIKAAKEIAYRPHKAAGDAVVAEYKPVLDEIARFKSGCTKLTTAFKNKLAAEKAEAARIAAEELEAKRQAAQAASDMADMGNLNDRRTADELYAEQREAERALQAAKKNTVKGLRTYSVATVTDYAAFFRWLQKTDKDFVFGWFVGIAQSVNYAKGEGSYIKSLSSSFVHIEYADDGFHKLKRGTHWQPIPTPPEGEA